MSAVYKKELKSMFCGMTGVIFIAFVLLWFGVFTRGLNLKGGYSQYEFTIASAAFISLLAIPIITMRSFAEEKHTKTDQLIYSLPIKTSEVVAAKYLAMVTVFAIPVVIIMLYPVILSSFGVVYLNTAYSTLLSYFLLGSSLIAVCMFVSSLTESQAIAAILSLGAIIFIYYLNAIASLFSTSASSSLIALIVTSLVIAAVTYYMTKNPVASVIVGAVLVAACLVVYGVRSSLFENLVPNILNGISLFSKTDNFIYGIFDVKAIIFYLSAIFLFNFLTVQAIEKKRWM